jgi:hypothetical protein
LPEKDQLEQDQLEQDQLEQDRDLWRRAVSNGSSGPAAQLAGFAGLLAGADVAVVVERWGHGLVVTAGGASSGSLCRGAIIETHPCLGHAGSVAMGLLLSGRLRWCHCSPPSGFDRAALVAAPSLAPSGRLLMFANRQGGFTELRLRAAAAYLAEVGQVGLSPVVELVRPPSWISGDALGQRELDAPRNS